MIRSFVFSQTQGRLISQDLTMDLLKVMLYDEGVQFWVDCGEGTDEEAKALLEGVFGFHPLAIEDCLTLSERPKVDEYENYVFLVIHAVDYSHSQHDFETTELNLFIGKNFLVTFHRKPLRCVTSTIERVLRNAPAVAKAPDRLTYTVLDSLLESYNPAMEELSAEISTLERSVLEDPSLDILSEVLQLQGEVQGLRQIVTPQRDVLTRFTRGEFKIVRASMLPYYRDLLDQLVRISDRADGYRESLMTTLQVHLNLQQMSVNRVIKVLTVLATLSMPMVVVTSFYGMNFRHMPELDWKYAYLWVFGVTAAATAWLYWFLRRRGWW